MTLDQGVYFFIDLATFPKDSLTSSIKIQENGLQTADLIFKKTTRLTSVVLIYRSNLGTSHYFYYYRVLPSIPQLHLI